MIRLARRTKAARRARGEQQDRFYLDTERDAKEAVLDHESAVGVIAALTLLLTPVDFNTGAFDDDGALPEVAATAFVIFNVLSAAFGAAALTTSFGNTILLRRSPTAAADEIIAALVLGRRGSFIQLRVSFFSLLFGVPFGVYLLHGRILFIVSFALLLIITLTNEWISTMSSKRQRAIVSEKRYARRTVVLQSESGRAFHQIQTELEQRHGGSMEDHGENGGE